MKKGRISIGVGLLAAAVMGSFPCTNFANPKVDSSGCLACHEVGVFGADDRSIHGSHSACSDCHAGSPGTGTVFTASCLACHPAAGSGTCDLVDVHEAAAGYEPSDASCLDCHGTCAASTTTTTTVFPSNIKGNRYEIFLLGPFREGCRSTTVTFRSDDVLILDCLDGFGRYLSIGNTFIAVYWTNNYYRGNGMGMMLTGVALDPYVVGGGIAGFGNTIRPVAIVGYIR